MVARARFIEEDRERCNGHVPHHARLAQVCLDKDNAKGGAWRRSTRSVELETSTRWLEPSNGLQSTGIHLDMEIGLMVVGGCCSIGAGWM